MTTTLTLSDDSGNASVKAAASDLTRADSAATIPAAKIGVEPNTVQVPNNAPAQVTITVNLAEVSANGEFTGKVYLYHETGRQVVPMTVRVKASPIFSWILMFAGVALGFWLTSYRLGGRVRDEVLLQANRLQSRVAADPELGNELIASQDFKACIEAKLKRIVSSVEDEDLDTAQAEVIEARKRWNRWEEYRDDWIAQFHYDKQLRNTVQEIRDENDIVTIFMQGVEDGLNSVHRKLRTGQYEKPQTLSEDFSGIRQQLTFYTSAKDAVDKLQERRQQLSDEGAETWRLILEDLILNLDNSEPGQKEQNRWQTLFDSTKAELEAEIAASQEVATPEEPSLIILHERSGGIDTSSSKAMPLVPRVDGIVSSTQVKIARKNLWWFNQTSRIVAIVALTWLGMIELYAGKPTFGADPLRDYFALFAWGFGAELTRDSVVKATQTLGSSKEDD